MKIKLPYLKDYIEINVPQDNVISVLKPNVIPETSESVLILIQDRMDVKIVVMSVRNQYKDQQIK